jgi:two-component system cell cycle response regulator
MRSRILTVDDSKTVQLIVRRAFRPFDCDVYEAPNGAVGIELALLARPDVILLDVIMPVMDGERTLIELRSSPDLRHVPVIMLATSESMSVWLKVHETGIRDFIAKPFGCDAVVRKVARFLALRPLAGSGGAGIFPVRGSKAPWRGQG